MPRPCAASLTVISPRRVSPMSAASSGSSTLVMTAFKSTRSGWWSDHAGAALAASWNGRALVSANSCVTRSFAWLRASQVSREASRRRDGLVTAIASRSPAIASASMSAALPGHAMQSGVTARRRPKRSTPARPMVQRSPSPCARRSSSPSAASRTVCDVDGWRRMPRSSVSGIARPGGRDPRRLQGRGNSGSAQRTAWKTVFEVSKGSWCNGIGMGRSFSGAAIRPARLFHGFLQIRSRRTPPTLLQM